jgi:hypothetical protein
LTARELNHVEPARELLALDGFQVFHQRFNPALTHPLVTFELLQNLPPACISGRFVRGDRVSPIDDPSDLGVSAFWGVAGGA